MGQCEKLQCQCACAQYRTKRARTNARIRFPCPLAFITPPLFLSDSNWWQRWKEHCNCSDLDITAARYMSLAWCQWCVVKSYPRNKLSTCQGRQPNLCGAGWPVAHVYTVLTAVCMYSVHHRYSSCTLCHIPCRLVPVVHVLPDIKAGAQDATYHAHM